MTHTEQSLPGFSIVHRGAAERLLGQKSIREKFMRIQFEILQKIGEAQRMLARSGENLPVDERLKSHFPPEACLVDRSSGPNTDQEDQDMIRLVQAMSASMLRLKMGFKFWTFPEILALMSEAGIFHEILSEKCSTERQRSILGKILKNYEGAVFILQTHRTYFRLRGRCRSRRYFLSSS